MRPRLTTFVALGSLACGGGAGPGKPVPQSSPQETITQFMTAVKANDLDRMNALWGDEHGPASGHMKADEVKKRLGVLQVYLNHVSYRVVEGPLPVPNKEDRRTFRVELQRATSCTIVFPLELARARGNRWFVVGTDLATLTNPAQPCQH